MEPGITLAGIDRGLGIGLDGSIQDQTEKEGGEAMEPEIFPEGIHGRKELLRSP